MFWGEETDAVQGRRVRTCSEAVPEVESQVGGSDWRLAVETGKGSVDRRCCVANWRCLLLCAICVWTLLPMMNNKINRKNDREERFWVIRLKIEDGMNRSGHYPTYNSPESRRRRWSDRNLAGEDEVTWLPAELVKKGLDHHFSRYYVFFHKQKLV